MGACCPDEFGENKAGEEQGARRKFRVSTGVPDKHRPKDEKRPKGVWELGDGWEGERPEAKAPDWGVSSF